MSCFFRFHHFGVALVAAALIFVTASSPAQDKHQKPFYISDTGSVPTGLPQPGGTAGLILSKGIANHLAQYTGSGASGHQSLFDAVSLTHTGHRTPAHCSVCCGPRPLHCRKFFGERRRHLFAKQIQSNRGRDQYRQRPNCCDCRRNIVASKKGPSISSPELSAHGGLSSASVDVLLGPITNPANGHNYYLLENASWTASQAMAVSLGGNLVTINDHKEDAWVFSQFSQFGGRVRDLWIGLNDVALEGSMVWSSGEPVDYTHWVPREPNNSGSGEHHVVIWGARPHFAYGGLWNDLSDSGGTYRVNGVVEVSATESVKTLKGHSAVVGCLAFSPDGQILASAGRGKQDNTVRLWDVATGRLRAVLSGHTGKGGIYSAAFSPDGKTLAASSENQVWLWDVETGKRRLKSGDVGWTSCLAYSPDGKTLAIGGSGGVTLCDADTVKVRTILKISKPAELRDEPNWQGAWSIAFSPDGKMIAVGGGGWHGQPKEHITLWDTATGEQLSRFPAHNRRIYAIAFSPDGRTLVSAGMDKAVKLWRLAELFPKIQQQDSQKHDPDEIARLVRDLDDANFNVRDTAAKKLNQIGRPALSALKKAQQEPGSAEVRLRVEKLIQVIVNPSLLPRSELIGHKYHIRAIAFATDSSRMASVSEYHPRGDLILWDLSANSALAAVNWPAVCYAVALSPDGKKVAVGVGNKVKILDVESLLNQSVQSDSSNQNNN